MNKLLISLLLILGACTTTSPPKTQKIDQSPKHLVTDDYELIIPPQQDGLLILFPCFPCDAENTRTEFPIVDAAINRGTAVLLMNVNQKLWLSENEEQVIVNTLTQAAEEHQLDIDNTYIGGFSSGGNVTLLISDYLIKIKSSLQPKGIFIVDSPIDLLGLYESAEKTIAKDYSDVAINEAKWITSTLDSEFGKGDTSLKHYEACAPYTSKTNSINNLRHLQDVKIRLYTEPDTAWWWKNRQTKYENMNAYFIEKLAADLTDAFGDNNIKLIKTTDRGYRSDMGRHPHSWSIVDEGNLLDWMKEKD